MKNIQMTVRLNPAIAQYFQECAVKNKSSFSQEVNRYLIQSFKSDNAELSMKTRFDQLEDRLDTISKVLELLATGQ